jgi:hypothetical protein
MRRLRTIIANEQRELITLFFSVLVFLLTLFASYLHDPGLTGNQSGDAVREFMSQQSRHDGSVGQIGQSIDSSPDHEGVRVAQAQ